MEVEEREPAAWPPLPEAQAKAAASSGVVKEVLVSGVSVSIANTVTNPLGERLANWAAGARGWGPRAFPPCFARQHPVGCSSQPTASSARRVPPPPTPPPHPPTAAAPCKPSPAMQT
jgi:hypothetical protein